MEQELNSAEIVSNKIIEYAKKQNWSEEEYLTACFDLNDADADELLAMEESEFEKLLDFAIL